MAEQNHQFKDFEHTLTSEPMQRGMRFEKKKKCPIEGQNAMWKENLSRLVF